LSSALKMKRREIFQTFTILHFYVTLIWKGRRGNYWERMRTSIKTKTQLTVRHSKVKILMQM